MHPQKNAIVPGAAAHFRDIVLVTVGSLGDLHPFIALGIALRERGCTVTLASAAEYRAKVEAAGLGFHAVRPSFADLERDLAMSRRDATARMLADSRFLFRGVVLPSLRSAYADLEPLISRSDLVLTSSLAFSARLAAERHGVPWIGVVLQPMLFLTAHDPPQLPGAAWLTRLMRTLGPGPTTVLLGGLRRVVGSVFRPLEVLRAELGLEPSTRDPLFDGQFGAAGAIGLYADVLGGIQPDFPPRTLIAGFTGFDSDDGRDAALPPALAEFLEGGPAPLVFTLGSLIVHSPGDFYAASVAAARRLRQRAVLLVGESPSEATLALAAADVCVCAYAPHSLLFPRAAVIVHHGGIGTLAQGLKSGRPTLIVPFFADQLDNAERAVRLGVALRVPPRRYTAERAAAALDALLHAPIYSTHAEALREKLQREDGAARAADWILAKDGER